METKLYYEEVLKISSRWLTVERACDYLKEVIDSHLLQEIIDDGLIYSWKKNKKLYVISTDLNKIALEVEKPTIDRLKLLLRIPRKKLNQKHREEVDQLLDKHSTEWARRAEILKESPVDYTKQIQEELKRKKALSKARKFNQPGIF